MPQQLGITFAPTFENSQLARSGGAGAQPQEALQVLSYRLPRVTGANAISPLVSDQMRGGPNMSVLESVFRTILGPDAAAALLRGQGVMPTGATPAPNVRPGFEDPRRPIGPVTPIAQRRPDAYDRGGWADYLANPPASQPVDRDRYRPPAPSVRPGWLDPGKAGPVVPLPSAAGTTTRPARPVGMPTFGGVDQAFTLEPFV